MKNRYKYILITAAGVMLFAVMLSGRYFSSIDSAESAVKTLIRVGREDLSLTMVERGLLHPAKVGGVKSNISSNQAQLVWSVEEGETVQKGQLVARFDTKPFIDRMEQAEQQLADVMATLATANKNLTVQQVEAEGRIEAAARQLDIAKIKADDLLNGSGKLQRRKLERQLEKAARVLKIVEQEQTDTQVLLSKGHVSRREYEQSVNEALSAQDSYDLALAELANFDHYEWPRMNKEAQLMIEAAEKDLEQTKRTTELELQRYRGEIVKLERDQTNAQKHLDDAMADVAACDLRAPIDGTLLYKELPRAEGRRKVQIGDNIWHDQTFMEIPDTSEMIVEIFVREIDVAKLSKGLPAMIELDALPGKRFQGQVDLISSLATEEEAQPGVRTFRTIVQLNELSQEMHAGMSANVHIRYQNYENTLVIPARALNYKNGRPFVWRTDAETEKPVEVELGALGTEKVQILAGLEENDEICLSGCGSD